MHRRCFKADLNEGFSATVSLLALIMRDPMAGSFAHEGTSPQLKFAITFWSARASTTGILCVGATLKFGFIEPSAVCESGVIGTIGELKSERFPAFTARASILNCAAMTFGSVFSVNLPHILNYCASRYAKRCARFMECPNADFSA